MRIAVLILVVMAVSVSSCISYSKQYHDNCQLKVKEKYALRLRHSQIQKCEQCADRWHWSTERRGVWKYYDESGKLVKKEHEGRENRKQVRQMRKDRRERKKGAGTF
jgi:hypothetical protein